MGDLETKESQNGPPQLIFHADGALNDSALADLIEWFLNYDERTARIKHPYTEELFQWKQHDDAESGVPIYPFENAEARFALGVYQAVQENNSEQELNVWISDILTALHDARETRLEIETANKIEAADEKLALEKAEILTSKAEKRLYLTSCWIEQLCTAEARVLGWVYQDLYGQPFAPAG
ncbi:MAG: hypothetical protein ABI539_12695 [Acidobacteriota bacterium]